MKAARQIDNQCRNKHVYGRLLSIQPLFPSPVKSLTEARIGSFPGKWCMSALTACGLQPGSLFMGFREVPPTSSIFLGPRLFWVFSSMASACVGSQGRYGYIQVKDHRRTNDDVHFRMDVVRDSGGLSLAFGDRVEFWIQPQGEGWRPTAAAAPWLASICIFHVFSMSKRIITTCIPLLYCFGYGFG